MHLLLCCFVLLQQPVPPIDAKSGDYIVKDFTFTSGEKLAELKLHYRTIGEPKRDEKGNVTNAILIMHGTTGSSGNFVRRDFLSELVASGQPFDGTTHYIILPDAIGHGSSSKPSDGLKAKFPRYGYQDMVKAQYLLVTEGLKVNHLKLVMGTSMGGMHTWLWGSMYPDAMDALLPLASLPTQISGRNRVWRRMISDAIRNDPSWNGGDYTQQPASLQTAAQMLYFMSSNPVIRQKEAPTRSQADQKLDQYVKQTLNGMDANNVLYAVEASTDYDPQPEKIKAPLLAINFADDLINPPELGLLEEQIKKVTKGKAITMPMTSDTRGHGTHTIPAVWKKHMVEWLKEAGVK